uniref:Uncharacterized protein n=1 Tax=Chromera velia CCMP2878 TaxID=1169474 RepID=A0A0G4FBL4_9ALVE|eukprot:Cvel_3064.t1-p1 / transcript=Cvel_3064.t1 / gene=Cvel_3064 / organism=Chromera_velia_CCMP2878 / gene_product=hypothetical protein / transcript_product=hypothetical protein / location=Cvel_scaffold122:76326-77976(-) / protein_length=204 / sequence_SO=supercontig / SO=protein_coding / is_pseudo=false
MGEKETDRETNGDGWKGEEGGKQTNEDDDRKGEGGEKRGEEIDEGEGGDSDAAAEGGYPPSPQLPFHTPKRLRGNVAGIVASGGRFLQGNMASRRGERHRTWGWTSLSTSHGSLFERPIRELMDQLGLLNTLSREQGGRRVERPETGGDSGAPAQGGPQAGENMQVPKGQEEEGGQGRRRRTRKRKNAESGLSGKCRERRTTSL